MTDARTPDDAPDAGLIVQYRDFGGFVMYRAGSEWVTNPLIATVHPTEAEAAAAAAEFRFDATVVRLLESGEIVSLDKQTDLYGDHLDVDDADAPF